MVSADWRNLSKRQKVFRCCDMCQKTQEISVESLRKYQYSEQLCARCRKKENGYTVSEETRKRISEGKKGKKIGPRPKEYIDKYLKGENNPFFGKSHCQESVKKMLQTRSKNPNFLLNLKEGLKKRDLTGPKNGMYGKSPAKPKRSKLRYKNYVFRSTWELRFAKFLDQENFQWDYENITLPLEDGSGYTPDFIIGKDIYEIKGYYWNSDEKFIKAKQKYLDYNFYILDQKMLKSMGVL